MEMMMMMMMAIFCSTLWWNDPVDEELRSADLNSFLWTECKKLSGSRIAPESDWIRYLLAIIIYFYRGICMRVHQPTAWIIDTEWRRKHWNKFKPPHRPSDGSTVDPRAVAARQLSSLIAIMRLREVRLKSTSFRYYRHLAIKFCRRQMIAWATVFT